MGMLVLQGKTKVTRKDGQLIYDTENDSQQKILFNIMSTPCGRRYQLVLSAGAKAWLNASSSIRYPAAFFDTERKVEITGEAYFEISSLIKKVRRFPLL
ncbi:MAG: FecR domain-containing protein [Chitinophagaceae bacterium]|nr:FecR domain-containing protein [Chitinophagaceae bacterium]